MKKCFYTYTLLLLFAVVFVPTATAQTDIPQPDDGVETQKRAQTGFKFLSTSVDPRATALGGAIMAELDGTSSSLFYNPASMAGLDGTFHAFFANTEFIADINYNAASVAYRPQGGNYGVFGLSFVNVDYGEFFETVRTDANEQGFVQLGTYGPSAFAIGLGYARSFTDRFQAGANVKYAFQDLGTFATERSSDGTKDLGDGTSALTQAYDQGTAVFDFGVVYHTGFRSLVIAMTARNFSQELTYVRERFELPLTFQIGASMDMVDLTGFDQDMHSLNLHVDASRPRDFTEHVKIGLEYTFMNLISLRGGMANLGADLSQEERGVNLGAGINLGVQDFTIRADYSYTDFGTFGGLNRVGVSIGY